MSDDDKKPWHRRADESSDAYGAFREYLDVPVAHRSFVAGFRKYSGKPEATKLNVTNCFYQWSRKFQWLERAEQFDLWMAQEEDRALLRAMQKYEDQLADERKKVNSRGMELAELFFKKAKEIASLPIFEPRVVTQADRDGRPVAVTVNPVKGIRVGDAARFAEVGDKIARLSVGLVTERTTIEIREKLIEIANETGLTPDEVAEMFRAESGKVVLLQ